MLKGISLPQVERPAYGRANMVARPGDKLTPPLDNADRLGCVITQATDRTTSEALADEIVANACVELV